MKHKCELSVVLKWPVTAKKHDAEETKTSSTCGVLQYYNVSDLLPCGESLSLPQLLMTVIFVYSY